MNDFNVNIGNLDFADSLKPITEKIVDTLSPVSDTLSAIFLFAFQKPMKYKIIKEAQLDSLAKLTREKFDLVDQNNVNFDNLELIGKILEDSIYQLNKEQFRELYSSLIVSTIDSTKTVKPYYSSLLKELSSDEAKLMIYFFNSKSLSEVRIDEYSPIYQLDNPTYPKDYLKFCTYNNIEDEHEELRKMFLNDFHSSMLESLYILLSFNLIETTLSDTRITEYLIENDEQLSDLNQKRKLTEFTPSTHLSIKTYTLTNLGKKIKSILTAYEIN